MSTNNLPAVHEVKTTCCYCGVGCGVVIETDGKQVLGVRGDEQHPANFGRLCSKGSTLHLTMLPHVLAQVRALQPEVRTQKNAQRTVSSWDNALDSMAEKFASTIAEHGPDSVAFYISGQLLTEDYYVFNKLAKGLIGTNNIDSNSRLCMSSAVAGYKQSLGADAPPNCYEDIDHAELIFIAGSNTAFAHPVLYRRIEAARKNNPQMKLVVVDPRRTDTARDADLHLAIAPGTDVALFHGMLHICLWEDLINPTFIAEHTEGFAELKRLVRDYTPAAVAQICGIKESDLLLAARWFGQSKASLSLYCQGLNQSTSGTAKNTALINLHLATGQIGKPGAGPFSLTGQPNAMGGREVGGMANLMSGHRDLSNPQHRVEIAHLWGVESVPATPGKTAVEMFEAVRQGQIKIIWIVCTNPAQSMPDQNLIREALNRAEMVIVQEAYTNTATVPYADVLLPAASWGEKSGTVTNSERCISRVNQAVPAPGIAKPDWQIAVLFAQKLERLLQREKSLFSYTEPEQIWNEHRASTAGRDVDITGLSYATLNQVGPQQWPFVAGAQVGKKRLYEDGIFATENGRARFIATPYIPVQEKVTPRHPFALTSMRLRDQWHGMSRTGTVPQLFSHVAEPVLYMAREDMARRLMLEGELVKLSNSRGEQVLALKESDELRLGQVALAMHWGEEYLSGKNATGSALLGINSVSSPAFDPVSKQPELKHSAVKIEKINLAWRFVAFAWLAEGDALRLQGELRSFMQAFTYATCVPFGRERFGLLFRAANHEPVDAAVVAKIEHVMGISGATLLRYDDAKTGNARHLKLKDGCIEAAALAGDISAENWLKAYLQDEISVAKLGSALLAPKQSQLQQMAPRASIVCSCFNISSEQIREKIMSMQGDKLHRLNELQVSLKCGTQCGSCVPELKKIISQTPAV